MNKLKQLLNIYFTMKSFITGLFIGIVSLIPGISGGTILVLFNQFEEFTTILTNRKEKEDYIYLFKLLLGISLGALLFAKIIEYLFTKIPYETLLVFSLIIIYSLPSLIKNEKEQNHLSKPLIILGMIIILLLNLLSVNDSLVLNNLPDITLIFIIIFCFYGAIDGFITILPGISGSLVMMILGPYFLYKSILANVTFDTLYLLIPLAFYLIGDLIGIYLGSITSKFLLSKAPKFFMSLIIGMVIMSTFVVMPFKHLTDIALFNLISAILISYLIYYLLIKKFSND